MCTDTLGKFEVGWTLPHFVVAERVRQGEVGGCTTSADSAWRLLQLAIERAWSVLYGQFFCLLVQTGVENSPFTL